MCPVWEIRNERARHRFTVAVRATPRGGPPTTLCWTGADPYGLTAEIAAWVGVASSAYCRRSCQPGRAPSGLVSYQRVQPWLVDPTQPGFSSGSESILCSNCHRYARCSTVLLAVLPSSTPLSFSGAGTWRPSLLAQSLAQLMTTRYSQLVNADSKR